MELQATTAGLPALTYEGVSYPLFYTVLGVKTWAEYSGRSFGDAVKEFTIDDLSYEDVGTLLRIGLEGGEKRRLVEKGGGDRNLDDLAEAMMGLDSLLEVWAVVVNAWSNTGDSPKGDDDGGEAVTWGEYLAGRYAAGLRMSDLAYLSVGEMNAIFGRPERSTKNDLTDDDYLTI